MISMRNCQRGIFKSDTRTKTAMTISRLCLGLMFNEYVSILLSIHSRDARERETSPSAAEAANPRLYLPAEYDRVQGLGTVVPTQS